MDIKTPDLFKMLESRYFGDAYAFFGNVPSCTGGGAGRTADAIAMGLWPSRGLYFEGFELKVSRSDYLHELKQPQKAEEIAQFCDKWWLVVSDVNIVKDDLPDNWGLLAAVGGKLKIIKQAPLLKPKQLDKEFVASLFRKLSNTYIPRSSIRGEIERVQKNSDDRAQANVKYKLEEFEKLKEIVNKFEKASGVNISYGWQIEEIGRAVKMVMEGKHLSSLEALRRLKNDIEIVLNNN